ncbi:tetratricopeptide repeat protein [Fundidesulfovibrio butyratiphilus]
MRNVAALFAILAVLTLSLAGCARKAPPPPPEPTAQEFFDAGLVAFRQGNYAYASGQFEQAVFKSASMSEAQYYLGLCHWKLNQPDKARQAFVDVLNLNPSNPQARESLGILLYSQGRYDEARKQLEIARGLNSVNVEVYLALGRIYLMESRCADAAEALSRGLTLDSSNPALKADLQTAKTRCGKAKRSGKFRRKASHRAAKPASPSSLQGGAAPMNPGSF